MYLEIGGNKLFVDYDQLNTMLTTGDPSLKGGEVGTVVVTASFSLAVAAEISLISLIL